MSLKKKTQNHKPNSCHFQLLKTLKCIFGYLLDKQLLVKKFDFFFFKHI